MMEVAGKDDSDLESTKIECKEASVCADTAGKITSCEKDDEKGGDEQPRTVNEPVTVVCDPGAVSARSGSPARQVTEAEEPAVLVAESPKPPNDASSSSTESGETERCSDENVEEGAFNSHDVDILVREDEKMEEANNSGSGGKANNAVEAVSDSGKAKAPTSFRNNLSGEGRMFCNALSSLLAYGESSDDDDEVEVIQQNNEWNATSSFQKPTNQSPVPSESSSSSSSTSLFFSEEISSESDEEYFAVRKKKVNNAERKTIHLTPGELTLDDLPPIEDLHISVPQDQCIPVGEISNIVDKLVVIQGTKDRPALDLDTVLFLEWNRPLGHVFDVFGPVAEPMYCVRFNSNDQIKEKKISAGMPVYYVPESPYTHYVFLKQLLQMKGSDASWLDNNEPPVEHLDYSDDESERFAKKVIKKERRPDDPDEPQRKRPTAYEQRMNERNLRMDELQRRRTPCARPWRQDRLIRPPAFTAPPPARSADRRPPDISQRPTSQFLFGGRSLFPDFRGQGANDSISPIMSPDCRGPNAFPPLAPAAFQPVPRFPPPSFQSPPPFQSMTSFKPFCNQNDSQRNAANFAACSQNNANVFSPQMMSPQPNMFNMSPRSTPTEPPRQNPPMGMHRPPNMGMPSPQTPPMPNMSMPPPQGVPRPNTNQRGFNMNTPPPLYNLNRPTPQTNANGMSFQAQTNANGMSFQAQTNANGMSFQAPPGRGMNAPQHGQPPNSFSMPQAPPYHGDNAPGPFPRPEFGPSRFQPPNHLTFHNPLHRPSTPTPPSFMF